MGYSYEFFQESADFLREKVPFTPELGIVLGSCLGPFAQEIQDPIEVDYQDIPNFLRSTAPSHAGKLIFGTVEGKKVVCMSGRFHSYEGYDFEQLVSPVRVLKLLGIRTLILTNAAGAVNLSYHPGDIMLIQDHIKLNGASPLRGPNLEEFGPRFCDMTTTYPQSLRDVALRCAEGTGLRVHEGIYFFMPGPQFETPAEIRAIRVLGGDAVGMSTVTEAITAAHCSLPVLGVSVMTNMGAGILDRPLSGDEVDETAKTIEERFSRYMKRIVAAL